MVILPALPGASVFCTASRPHSRTGFLPSPLSIGLQSPGSLPESLFSPPFSSPAEAKRSAAVLRSQAESRSREPYFQQLTLDYNQTPLDCPDILELETGRLRKAAAVKRSALRTLFALAAIDAQRCGSRCLARHRHRPNA
jgi:hypothetical protein